MRTKSGRTGRIAVGTLLVMRAAVSLAQLPAGTHSVDDTSRQDAAAQQMREAESDLR